MAKVLVVDDSPTEIHQFKDMLEKMGHEVLTAENGRRGVALASTEQPDLVLMDVVMPGMNGFHATRLICRGSETHHIPVVIVSRKSQDADRIWGERQGARGYLTKPVNHHELVTIMESVL